ncbi:spheroidene monooxygenase [Tabrizicola aquatica]|uniref:spheroidene monooxygenase n=1 Tax=Tabrizicola aquatica TaxID=909926 RepID=UPI002481AF88|nr:spheroidene monooxygenase [Tabrizicola aquatica]
MPTATLSLFRFQGLPARLWVIGQMALARLALRRDSRLLFWKLCGSGTGEGFTPKPNWGVWAILAVWPDEEAARDGIAGSPVWRRWRNRASESATVYLSPLSARGSWSGRNPFVPDPHPKTAEGPLAVLTRASVKPGRALRFWRRVPDIQKVIGADPNVQFKIGIGEVPLLNQITFSIWPDTASMARFARGDGPHGRAIQAVRAEGWFTDELYARFAVLGVEGQWNGAPLLPARARPPVLDTAAPPFPASPQGTAGLPASPPPSAPTDPDLAA